MSKKKLRAVPEGGRLAGLGPGKLDILCVGLLYLVLLILFRGLVFESQVFTSEGDAANHLSYQEAGNKLKETEGSDPLWSPYVFSGMPTFGNVSYIPHNVSYAETLLMTLLRALFLGGPASGFIASFFLGGLGMFFLMRVWSFPRAAALIAALTFMLSPYAVGLGEAGHGSKLKALMYLPVILLLTDQMFRNRNLLSFGLLAAGIGTLMLTNHVQIVYYVFIVIGLYALYQAITSWKEHSSATLGASSMFIGTLVAGLAIASYIYLSVYEYSTFSIRGGGTEGAAGGLTWEYATNWSMPPAELVTLLIPSFFGFRSPYYWGSMPFTSSTIYIGLLPVFLSVVALFYSRNRNTLFFLGLTVLAILMSFGKHFAILYDLLFSYLPFFNKFRAPSTILHLLPLTLGVLAAFGYVALLSLAARTDTFRVRKVLTVLLVVTGSLLVIASATKSSLFSSLSDSLLIRDGELQSLQQQFGGKAAQYLDQLKKIRFFGNEQIAGLWGDYVRFSILTMIILGCTIGLLRSWIKRGLFAASIVALVIVDLWSVDAKFINPVPAKSYEERFRADQTITFLKQQPDLFRVFPLGEQFMDNTFAYHQIQSTGGYSPAKLKIYQTMIDSCFYRGVDPSFPLNMNVVNMLNVVYFVASGRLPEERFPLVHVDEARRKLVYANPTVLPRAFFVGEVRTALEDSEVFRIINSAEFNAATMAVVQTNSAISVMQPDSSRAEISQYQSGLISIRAFTSSPALLVLSEIYYPAGWNAFLDGAPVEIFRTNSILRSVLVPRGEHLIEFRFEPPLYEAGWALSHGAWGIVGLSIAIGLWNIPFIRRRISMGRNSPVKTL